MKRITLYYIFSYVIVALACTSLYVAFTSHFIAGSVGLMVSAVILLLINPPSIRYEKDNNSK
jgi:hypothetical protein